MPNNLISIPFPVSGAPSPSSAQTFGASRAKYGLDAHNGIDLAVSIGTPVFAPLAGTVITLGNTPLGGISMQIVHANGYTTGYAHLNDIVVANGTVVTAGQLVAHTGNTGSATSGAHLHFTLKINGKPVDPYPYLKGDASQLSSVQVTPESSTTTDPKEYLDHIVIDDQGIDTLQKFVDRFSLTISVTDLLNYKDNSQNILAGYTKKQKHDNNNAATVNLVTVGTRITVPLRQMKSNNPYVVNQTLLVNLNYRTFIEAEIAKLIKDPKYKRLDLVGRGLGDEGAIYKKVSQVSIWVWSRLISPSGRYLIDLSPFVKSVNTNVTKEGGNFTINLPNISFDKVRKDNSVLSAQTNLTPAQISELYQLPVININKFQDSDLNYNSFVTKSSSHTIEKLSLENPSLTPASDNALSSPVTEYFKLKNSLFHHIIQANDVVFIRLEKLEIDQENYFDTKEGYTIIDNTALNGCVFDMIGLVDSNPISLDGKHNRQTISVTGRDLSKLLIDDGVFFFPVEYSVKDRESIIKNSSKTKVADRLLADASPYKPGQTTASGLFADNITRAGQLVSSTVNFNFDLQQKVSDWLLFIFQQLTNITIAPNALFSSYPDKSFVVSKSDKAKPDGSYTYRSTAATGIWQIVKLVMDQNISERYVIDSSLSTDTGSLINLVRKVCQDPFAEFTGDTFGDKYYFTLRKPPFVSDSFKTNKTINIFDYDVLASNFNFSDQIYSWYRLTPMGSVVDTSDSTLMNTVPAVLLPEYVEQWGTKILDIQTNYLDFYYTESAESQSVFDNILKQANEDLDWLIESTAYLPFSRVGNITMKADRTIKRGMCVRFFPTGEIFHVDGVSHVRSFEGTTEAVTVLTVSHGIVEKHYDKYFNVVNLKRNSANKDTWSVNKDIFNFFVSKQQFIS